MKKNIFDDPSEDSVKITHITGIGPSGIQRVSSVLGLYLDIEAYYYINNKVTSIHLSLPKKMKGITFLKDFFKIAGFKKYEEYNFRGEFHLLLKDNLEEWYENNNGKPSQIIVTGENGLYKPMTKKEAHKLISRKNDT